MNSDFEIITNSGKRYKSFRALHIAMGKAVRSALLNFYKDVKDYAIREVENMYASEFNGSEYYDNTYGMISALENSNDVDGAISYYIRGSFEKRYSFEIEIDWSYLDSHSNGRGQFGTYTSFDGSPVVNVWDELLQSGLPIGLTGERHTSFDLTKIIQDYIEKNIEQIVDRALEPYV